MKKLHGETNRRRASVHDQASGFDVLPEGNIVGKPMLDRAFGDFSTRATITLSEAPEQTLCIVSAAGCDCASLPNLFSFPSRSFSRSLILPLSMPDG